MAQNLPTIAIGIITYNRPDEIRQTIQALNQFSRYPGGVHWFIADDSSPGDYRFKLKSDLRQWFEINGVHDDLTILKTESNVGWGANANMLFFVAEFSLLGRGSFV